MYESFAAVYDTFMDNVPYEEWTGRITELLKEHGIEDGIVLDLGCGTGSLTVLLSQAGYDMIGADISPQMLQTYTALPFAVQVGSLRLRWTH